MPSYDYYCSANGQTIEVKHSMSEKLTTWGQVCELAELELGDIAAETPVERLITGGNVVSKESLKNPMPHSCGTGGCGICG